MFLIFYFLLELLRLAQLGVNLHPPKDDAIARRTLYLALHNIHHQPLHLITRLIKDESK